MHKGLLRQLKRATGLSDEASLQALFQSAQDAASLPGVPPALAQLLGNLGTLVERVDATYTQLDRDLDLRARSLELSSTELHDANQRLRADIAARARAIAGLRTTLSGLLRDGADPAETAPGAQDELEQLSGLMSDLIRQREKQLIQLDNLKFALDQHAIVSITDTAGTITYANDKFCQISGYARDELIGQNHRIVRSGLHPGDTFTDMWQTITCGKVWHGEICNRKKEGGTYWVSATIVPMLDQHNHPTEYIAIRTDISARKQAEQRLAEELHFSKQMMDAIPVPIYHKAIDGSYLGCNPSFAELFGIGDVEHWLGTSAYELVAPQVAAFHAAKDAQLFSHPGQQRYEMRDMPIGNTTRSLMYHKASLTRPDGSVRGLIGAIIDMTDRYRWEEGIIQARDAAQAANRAKSDFLANMSHEIRTPINGIMGMTDVVLGTLLEPRQREYLEIVKSSSDALLTLINDILDFSKIEAGKLTMETIRFDLQQTVADTLKTLTVRAQAKGLTLHCEAATALPAHLVGDPGRLRQIVLNLVGNAIKFTDHGSVTVRMQHTLPSPLVAQVEIAVIDTGIGIAPEKQVHIFDAFTQEDTSTTRKYGGTGLGLTISNRLVQMMGGRLRVDSVPNQGSTFTFTVTLPIDTPAPAATATVATPLPSNAAHGALRVLLVEDNPINQRLAMLWLEKWGHQVTVAENGQLALDALDQSGFDVALMDMQMPVLDGLAATREIRRREQAGQYPHLPIIAMTANAMQSDREACLEAGMDDYLSKPLKADDLAKKLQALRR